MKASVRLAILAGHYLRGLRPVAHSRRGRGVGRPARDSAAICEEPIRHREKTSCYPEVGPRGTPPTVDACRVSPPRVLRALDILRLPHELWASRYRCPPRTVHSGCNPRHRLARQRSVGFPLEYVAASKPLPRRYPASAAMRQRAR